MSRTDAEVDTKIKLKKPSMYNVLLLNDDFTPMDFVVEVLQRIFDQTFNDSSVIMLQIHRSGKGIANKTPYTREIANQKALEVKSAAENSRHPLRAALEEL